MFELTILIAASMDFRVRVGAPFLHAVHRCGIVGIKVSSSLNLSAGTALGDLFETGVVATDQLDKGLLRTSAVLQGMRRMQRLVGQKGD